MESVSLGYTIFYVDDVEATVNFFTKAFGLETRLLTPEKDYGEVETGPTTLAFVSLELGRVNLDDAGGFLPPNENQPSPVSITLLTADVEATAAAALSAGAKQYVSATEKPWGQTVAYVLGPNNILIEIATPVAAPQ